MNALEKGIAIGEKNLFGNPRKKAEAIEYFKQALIENPRETEAWMWISQLQTDGPTQRYCFQRVLEIEPNHPLAKMFLDSINDRDSGAKWIPERPSPLQPFFDNMEKRRQYQSQGNTPFFAPQPPPNFRTTRAPVQKQRRVQRKRKTKKKGISPWISSFFIFTLLIIIISILVPIVGIPLLSYLAEIDPSISPEEFGLISPEEIALGGVMLGGGTFFTLFPFLIGLYWFLSGYAGAFLLLKKGYVLELVGCSILAAGVPLLLPAVLGPFMYWWGSAVQDKHR